MAKETEAHGKTTARGGTTPEPDPDVPDATDVEIELVDITEPTGDHGEPVHRNEGGDLGSGGD